MDAERLEVVGTLHAVDDESGRVGRDHRRLAELTRQQGDRVSHGGVRRRSGNDFHQRHQRHGIEEMHADHPFRPHRGARDLCDRQGARVRRQYGRMRGSRVQPFERLPLELEVLGNRLDHQVGVGQVLESRHRSNAGHGDRGVIGADLLLLCLAVEEAADALACSLRGALDRVVNEHREPRFGHDLRDPRAHGPGPEHANGPDLVHRPRKSGSRFSANAATPSA